MAKMKLSVRFTISGGNEEQVVLSLFDWDDDAIAKPGQPPGQPTIDKVAEVSFRSEDASPSVSLRRGETYRVCIDGRDVTGNPQSFTKSEIRSVTPLPDKDGIEAMANATFDVYYQNTTTPAGAGHTVALTLANQSTIVYGPLTTDANGQVKKSVQTAQYDIYVDGVKDPSSPWGLGAGIQTIPLPDVPQ